MNKNVLQFITNFVEHTDTETITKQFGNGYCYHFAHMLKSVYRRGEVCWAAPFSHFVLLLDDIPYDINGVYSGEAEYFIPERYLGNAVDDFKRVPGIAFNATQEDIDNIINTYLQDINKPVEKCIYCSTRGMIVHNGPKHD